MKKIEVLILVDKFDYHGSYINGPTRYFSWLINGIDRHKFNVHLCALRGRGASDVILRKENLNVDYLNASKYSPFIFLKIISVVLKKRISILHLTGYGATTHGRIAALLCRKPCIIHEHWVDPKMSIFQKTIERSLSILPTSAIACSEYARQFLIKEKGIREDRIVVIPNGVPLERFHNVDGQGGQAKRDEFGFHRNCKIIGMVGMLHENKGHRYFIEAASRLYRGNRQLRFVIVGDGELRDKLEQQVVDYALEGVVRFLGHQEDISAILQMLDIFVVASISETFPLSLLEAMAAAKTIVITDCGGPTEIIIDGVTGCVVPVRDAAALAVAIQSLLDNPSLANCLARNACIESRKYRIEFTVQRVQCEYERKVGSRSQARTGNDKETNRPNSQWVS